MAKLMNILLQRGDSVIPWGFKIRGENGNGVPFVVHQVTPGTIASNYLHPGDVIVKLSHHLAKDLMNKNVEEIIRQAGNSLELIISKRPAGSLSPSSPSALSPIPPPGVANASPKCFTPTSPLPPGIAQDYTSPGISTPPLPPYPTHVSSPTPYMPPPPPPPPSFSPVASPRSSMVFPPSYLDGDSFPLPPPPMPPSPLTTTIPNTNTSGHSPPCTAPPPPPPPLPSGDELSVPWRVRKMNIEPKKNMGAPSARVEQFDKLPAALQSTMMKDKKPFTYTPGGIDLSELRSPRMQRRIHVNQMDTPRNVAKVPIAEPPAPDMRAQVISPPPPPPPPETYPQTRVQLLPSAQGQPMAPPTRSKSSTQGPQSPQQPSPNAPIYNPQHYNSPIHLYSTDNVAESYQTQTRDALPGNERKPVNMQNDATPRRASDGLGDAFTPYYKGQQAQSRSFRLLQVMTDTTSDAREDGSATTPKTPTRPDDEMKFTGLRRNPIPSRAFQTLQRITGEENGHTASHPPVSSAASQENPDTAETELRYRGAYIPSRSFRILQEMTGERDEDVMATRSTTLPRAKKTAVLTMQIGSDVDSVSSNSASPVQRVPPSEQKAEAEPKKYTGACIPSKSFRMLQAMTGSDDSLDDSVPDSPIASNADNAQSDVPRMYMGGKIPSRSFRLLQAMTDPDRADRGSKRPGAF